MNDITIDLQESDTWKIQLTIAINVISSKNVEEERVMPSKSDNIKFVSYKNANEVVDELLESLPSRYQSNLETSMRGSDFIFNSVQLSYCKCHKVNFRHGGSNIDSPDWVKTKKATINPKNKDDKCFQYTVTVPLKYEGIKWNPERASKIKPFINKNN